MFTCSDYLLNIYRDIVRQSTKFDPFWHKCHTSNQNSSKTAHINLKIFWKCSV